VAVELLVLAVVLVVVAVVSETQQHVWPIMEHSPFNSILMSPSEHSLSSQ
jgi:hypothetical protein